MLRTRAAVASILALSGVAMWCATLGASPSTSRAAAAPWMAAAAAPPLSSGPPATTTEVNAGPPSQVKVLVRVQVPNLVGLSRDELPKALAAVRLTLGNVTGTVGAPVTAQNPAAGQFVDPAVPIDVTLGAAGTTSFIRVPEVRRLSVTRARRAVHALGLRFVTTSRTGYVTTQEPLPGAAVTPGSLVLVVAGTRVLGRYVNVPDVRGDSVDAARVALTGIGLTLSTPAGAGTVASQDPQPGQRALFGSSVSVTLAVGAAPSSARPRPSLPYWLIGALVFVALAVAGGYSAHRRARNHRGRDRADPAVPPAPRVTSRLVANTLRTTRIGPPGPTVELHTRVRSSLKIERIP